MEEPICLRLHDEKMKIKLILFAETSALFFLNTTVSLLKSSINLLSSFR